MTSLAAIACPTSQKVALIEQIPSQALTCQLLWDRPGGHTPDRHVVDLHTQKDAATETEKRLQH